MDPLPLSKITSKTARCTIEVKILRIWKSINPKANNYLMSHNFLAVDIQNNAIQGVIKPSDMHVFESTLEEDEVFLISNFFVNEKNKLYNVIPAEHKINFVKTTNVKRSTKSKTEFPEHHFNFANKEELETRSGSNILLSELLSMGKIGSTYVGDSSQQVIKRNLQIRISEEDTISITLWGDFAYQLEDENFVNKNNPPIVAFAAMTVGSYMGKLSIATCSASRIILNPDIQAAMDLKQRLISETEHVQLLHFKSTPKLPPNEEKKLNRRTIKELLEITASDVSDTKFTCEANILELENSKGWFYNSCNECNKALTPLDGIFWCSRHKEKVPQPRCKIPFILDDGTGIMQIMFFGNPEQRLVKNSMMSLIMMVNGNPMVLPEPLKSLENKTKIFQISMTKSQEQNNLNFSINNVYDVDVFDETIPMLSLSAPNPIKDPSNAEKPTTLTKRKDHPEEEPEESSPTKTKIPTDLFQDDSPAKPQKQSKVKKKEILEEEH